MHGADAHIRRATCVWVMQPVWYAETGCTAGDFFIMTSEERREARYQRRQQRRQQNRRARSDACGSLDEIFSLPNLFYYGRQCCNGVRWKRSTQIFELHLLSACAALRRDVLAGTWKPRRCASFTIHERGKTRHIEAPCIRDRMLCKVLTNEVIAPLYRPTMIEDNGACQKGRGLQWQFERLKRQLRRHYRRHGRQGAVLLLDLRGFFPNANRALIYERHAEHILNPEVRRIADTVIRYSPRTSPGRGVPLGVELSQIEMAALPSKIDNWLKCQCHIQACGHYMDDYYIILPDAEDLRVLGRELIRRFEAAGIAVNPRKCRIVPLDKPFKFCKATFRLTETGRVIVNGCRDGVKRARRKLRKFRRDIEAGTRTMAQVDEYMTSQLAYYSKYDDHGRVLRLNRLYYALFHEMED